MIDASEFDSFKRNIDLRQFAATFGYQIDKRESWRGSAVLRKKADKIIVKRGSSGHYVYFSVRDSQDNGTIIDFVKYRKNLGLGEIRKMLRPWIGREDLPAMRPLEKTRKDRRRVERAYLQTSDAPCHPYLEKTRGVPPAVLSSSRFAGRVRSDRRGNAIFPHFDDVGLCGFEIKNDGFTGFATGGTKGLWLSRRRPKDRRIVFAESAIDALSFASLFPDTDDLTRYASLGGRPSSKQLALVRAAVRDLSGRPTIVAAFDADDAGRSYVEMLRRIVAEEPRGIHGLEFVSSLPSQEGLDWNDVLKGGVR